jgi:hypothetical protein
MEPLHHLKAVPILVSCSLISRDKNRLISIHPLVHMWARDPLQTAKAKRVWMVTVSMMALSIPSTLQTSDYRFQQSLVPHIDACLRFKKDRIFYLRKFGENCLSIAEKFALAYEENDRR